MCKFGSDRRIVKEKAGRTRRRDSFRVHKKQWERELEIREKRTLSSRRRNRKGKESCKRKE